MQKRASKFATSLKQIGDIQVNDWDFMALLNTEINELEITRSLRRLGQIRVTEWDFKEVLPAVEKMANQEVDVIDILKRAAHYKVMEWDFRHHAAVEKEEVEVAAPAVSEEEMLEVIVRLKNFLEFVTVNLIDEPKHAQIKVARLGPNVLRFRMVLVKRDVATLIGMQGQTAAAIRGMLKAAAGVHGVQALLQIQSHEEEAVALAKEGKGR